VAIIAASLNPAVIRGQEFFPRWEVGSTWQVQTQYTQYQEMSQEPGQTTTQWNFEVVEQDERYFVVQVRNADDPEARIHLWVDRETMSLQQQSYQFQAQGQTQDMQGQFPGQGMVPQWAQIGPCPAEMPLFPVGQQAEQTYQRDLSGFEEEIFPIDISQQERWTDDPGNIQEYLAQFPHTEEIDVQAAPFYYIVESEYNVSRVRQIWAQEVPWYLVSINDNSISWLVDY